jgi:hypothetical protein
MARKKTPKEQEKFTPGFRTYTVELMAVLDVISPNAERLYRKIFQHSSLHGHVDKNNREWAMGETSHSWKYLRLMSGLADRALSKSIRELEHYRLIKVNRPTKEAARLNHDKNVYFVVPHSELPQDDELVYLNKAWLVENPPKTGTFKGKATLTTEAELLSDESRATLTAETGLLSLPRRNKDEENKYVYNQYVSKDEWDGELSKEKGNDLTTSLSSFSPPAPASDIPDVNNQKEAELLSPESSPTLEDVDDIDDGEDIDDDDEVVEDTEAMMIEKRRERLMRWYDDEKWANMPLYDPQQEERPYLEQFLLMFDTNQEARVALGTAMGEWYALHPEKRRVMA